MGLLFESHTTWVNRTAHIETDSTGNRHRYSLLTIWDESKPVLGGLFCNPSQANAVVTDNTDKLFRRRASLLGYGGTWIANMFAIIGTDPGCIKRVPLQHAIGHHNDDAILGMALGCRDVLCAWGNHANINHRPQCVLAMLREANTESIRANKGIAIRLFYLAMTKQGQPGHPLYLKSDLPLVPWPVV